MQAMIAITLVITVKYICQHRTYRGVFITGFQCSPVIKITATGNAQNMQQFCQGICLSQGISDLCFFSVVQVTDTDARVFFYDFLRFFQNIQFHLPAAYFLIQSGDFLLQRIVFCLQERVVMFMHSQVSTVADNFIFPLIQYRTTDTNTPGDFTG